MPAIDRRVYEQRGRKDTAALTHSLPFGTSVVNSFSLVDGDDPYVDLDVFTILTF